MGAYEALLAAGWTQARRVDVSGDERALQEAGFAVWPELRELLAAFSGIEVSWRSVRMTNRLWIDGVRAAELIAGAWAEDYERYIASRVTPIGDHTEMTLMASADGRFLGGYQEYLYPLPGRTLIEVIDNWMKPPDGIGLSITDEGIQCTVPIEGDVSGPDALIDFLTREYGATPAGAEPARAVQIGREVLHVNDLGRFGSQVTAPDGNSPAVMRLAADLRIRRRLHPARGA